MLSINPTYNPSHCSVTPNSKITSLKPSSAFNNNLAVKSQEPNRYTKGKRSSTTTVSVPSCDRGIKKDQNRL